MRVQLLTLWLAIALLLGIVLINAYSAHQDIDTLADTLVRMLEVDKTLIDAFYDHIIDHQEIEPWLEDPSESWPRDLRARPL